MEEPTAALGDIFSVIKTSEDLLCHKQRALDKIEEAIAAEQTHVSAVQSEVAAISAQLYSLQAEVPGYQLKLHLQTKLASSLQHAQIKHQQQLRSLHQDLKRTEEEAESAVSALEELAMSVHSQLQLDGSCLLAGAAEKRTQLRGLQLEQAALSCELRLREDLIKDAIKARSCCLSSLRQLQHHQRQQQQLQLQQQLHQRSRREQETQLATELEQKASEVEEECECLQSVAAALRHEIDSMHTEQRNTPELRTGRRGLDAEVSPCESPDASSSSNLQRNSKAENSLKKPHESTSQSTTQQNRTTSNVPCSNSQQEERSNIKTVASEVAQNSKGFSEVISSPDLDSRVPDTLRLARPDELDAWWSNDVEFSSMEENCSVAAPVSPDWGELDWDTLSICTNPSELDCGQSGDLEEAVSLGPTTIKKCSDRKGAFENSKGVARSNAPGTEEQPLPAAPSASLSNCLNSANRRPESETHNGTDSSKKLPQPVISTTDFSQKSTTVTHSPSYFPRPRVPGFATDTRTSFNKASSASQAPRLVASEHNNKAIHGSTNNSTLFTVKSTTQKNFTAVRPFSSSFRPPLQPTPGGHNLRGSRPVAPPVTSSQPKTVRFKFQRTSMIDLQPVRRPPVPQRPILKSSSQYKPANHSMVNQYSNSSEAASRPFLGGGCVSLTAGNQIPRFRPHHQGALNDFTPNSGTLNTLTGPGKFHGRGNLAKPAGFSPMNPPTALRNQSQQIRMKAATSGPSSVDQGRPMASLTSNSINSQSSAAPPAGRFPRPWAQPMTCENNFKSNHSNIQSQKQQSIQTNSFQGTKSTQFGSTAVPQPIKTLSATQAPRKFNAPEVMDTNLIDENTMKGSKRECLLEQDSLPAPPAASAACVADVKWASALLPGPVTFTRDTELGCDSGIVFAGSAAVNRAALASKRFKFSDHQSQGI